MRLGGSWRPLCPWLGLALLANRPCYWLRRLHSIQDANRRAEIPRPGETSGPGIRDGPRDLDPPRRGTHPERADTLTEPSVRRRGRRAFGDITMALKMTKLFGGEPRAAQNTD